MMTTEHILIAYGHQLGYYNGAKYQILKNWAKYYSAPDSGICVVTDTPKLFDGYPVRVLQLTDDQVKHWSLDGRAHFGIKLKSLEWAAITSKANKIILLDTDMCWIHNPRRCVKLINEKTFVLYRNEGHVIGSPNRSTQRFEEGLMNKTFLFDETCYKLSRDSQMFGSAIIGFAAQNHRFLNNAFELFKVLTPEVKAHTVEQFALSEILRLNNLKVYAARRFVTSWSSIGRKNYATPILQDFFNQHATDSFEQQQRLVKYVDIRRPFSELIKQKYLRWKNKRSRF